MGDEFNDVRKINEDMNRLYKFAKQEVIEQQVASVSFLQRKFWIGYIMAYEMMGKIKRTIEETLSEMVQ
ncbi:DNA translocase FtsK [Bacillus thuringiensis]|uniref:FtsK gamma domain-containing protein n=1 Tax=Bacillus thuringiensis serovar andalousiensis TaxID=257985 RepID=A0A6H0TIJ9_BACTU|nr:DNA translocase FtsK [Bacillus thuringiensis]QIW19046.1 hypothetical protein EVG22_11425 [Bacillus thuringiensis serovar andalousiensis]